MGFRIALGAATDDAGPAIGLGVATFCGTAVATGSGVVATVKKENVRTNVREACARVFDMLSSPLYFSFYPVRDSLIRSIRSYLIRAPIQLVLAPLPLDRHDGVASTNVGPK